MPQQVMRPMHTFRHASRKMAATTTVPATPKWSSADLARIAAPFAASGITSPMLAPTHARPQ